jgi:8-oxo-dGTP diphosphatase
MSAEHHFIGKVSLRAVIINEGKVLLNRDAEDTDIWELPGGRLHVDETPEEGLKREILEELGVEVCVSTIIYVEQFKQTRTGEPSFMVTYEANFINPKAQLQFSDGTIAEVKWITKTELMKQKIYDNCLNALKAYFSKN